MAALAAGGGLTAGPSLWGVVGVAALTLLPWAVRGGDRTAVTLIHLPILAAVYLCSPAVAPAAGRALAAIDNRAFGRTVVIASAGAYALAAAAAVGAFELAAARGPRDRPRGPRMVRRARSSPPRPSSWSTTCW